MKKLQNLKAILPAFPRTPVLPHKPNGSEDESELKIGIVGLGSWPPNLANYSHIVVVDEKTGRTRTIKDRWWNPDDDSNRVTIYLPQEHKYLPKEKHDKD